MNINCSATISGVLFGCFMWLINGIVPAVIQVLKTQIFSLSLIFNQGLVSSIMSGLCFGIIMHFYYISKSK